MTETKAKKNIGRIAGLTALILASALLIVYLVFVWYFRDRLPFHTYYRGEDVSERSPVSITRVDHREQASRFVSVVGRDGAQQRYRLSSWLGYRENAEEPEAGFQPSPWLWPLSLWQDTQIDAAVERTLDEDAADTALRDIMRIHASQPVSPRNAWLDRSEIPYVIVPEIEGNTLNETVVRAVIEEILLPEIREGSGDILIDLEEAEAYVQPAIRQGDRVLTTALANYETIGFETIRIDMTGEVLTLGPDDILMFYDYDRTGRLQGLNRDRVEAYAAGLKERYDTYERATDFVDHAGNTVQVGTWRDTYGFRLDTAGTTDLLMETFAAGQSAQIEPVWQNKALARAENGCDLGDTYIEISISAQHLWAYIDGELFCSTDVVTGNAGNHSSPKGEFYILYFQRNATLKGEGYESLVSYWMPITQGGVGLHDASWRSSFGGSIYTYNGSHGCINMPAWAAKKLYWNYTVGTPVVIY